MDVESTFEADAKLAETGKPGMRALDDPPMTPKALLALNALTSNTCRNSSPVQILLTATAVVCLIGVQFVRSFARPAVQAWQRRNCIQRWLEGNRVVPIGARHGNCQRKSPGIYDDVSFAAQFAPVRRVGPCLRAPRGLGTLAPSILALVQSIWSCSRILTSSATCSRSHTPSAFRAVLSERIKPTTLCSTQIKE